MLISAHAWRKPVTAFAGEFGEIHDDALYNAGLRYHKALGYLG